MTERAVLREVTVGGEPDAWRDAGFALTGGTVAFDGLALRVDPGRLPGVAALAVEGLSTGTIDGMPVVRAAGRPAPGTSHPNAVTGLDHLVIATPDLGRTVRAFAARGLEPRREREAGAGVVQAFFLLGTCVAEVVGPLGDPGPAILWGLAFVTSDAEGSGRALGKLLGPFRPAIQKGRRIATVSPEAGLGVRAALMTPREP